MPGGRAGFEAEREEEGPERRKMHFDALVTAPMTPWPRDPLAPCRLGWDGWMLAGNRRYRGTISYFWLHIRVDWGALKKV